MAQNSTDYGDQSFLHLLTKFSKVKAYSLGLASILYLENVSQNTLVLLLNQGVWQVCKDKRIDKFE